jgi:hypothetical protein
MQFDATRYGGATEWLRALERELRRHTHGPDASQAGVNRHFA